jgi:hypothetical protein
MPLLQYLVLLLSVLVKNALEKVEVVGVVSGKCSSVTLTNFSSFEVGALLLIDAFFLRRE